MQTAKTKAETMLPKLCNEQNKREDMSIANTGGAQFFNLFNNTPLNINSSDIGETITVEKNPPTKDIVGTEKLTKNPKDGKLLKRPLDKYNIPYEKKMFRKTINRMYFSSILEKILIKPYLNSLKLSFSLKTK